MSKWPKRIWRTAGYTPNELQAEAHVDSSRTKLVAGGERGGKSYSAAMELLARCNVAHGLFWIVGPTYDLARPEFEYVAEALSQAVLVKDISWPRRGPCSLTTLTDARIITRSADDPARLAAEAPDGILMCEAAQHSYNVFLRLRGRVAEKRGWLWMSGTFEGSLGWYAEYWKRWQADNPEGARSFSLPTWSNLAVFPGGENDPEIVAMRAVYPDDVYQERLGAVPCPPSTIVFREYSYAEHVKSFVQYNPSLPVEVAVDPGYAGAYAVEVLQEVDGRVFDVDEVYVRGMIAENVIAVCKERLWWPEIEGGVIDIAGTAHPGDRSQQEIWQEHGVFLRANRVGEEAGRLRLHTFLRDPASGEPRILFSSTLAGGVDGVGNPRGVLAEFGLYKFRDVKAGQPEREKPVDRDNHGIKALSYWLFDRYGAVDREKPRLAVQQQRVPGLN